MSASIIRSSIRWEKTFMVCLLKGFLDLLTQIIIVANESNPIIASATEKPILLLIQSRSMEKTKTVLVIGEPKVGKTSFVA